MYDCRVFPCAQEEFLDPSFLDVVSYCRQPDGTVTGFLQLPSVTDHGR